MRSPVFYVEIPPSLFAPVIKGLADGGLLPAQARVVVEKPFGHDLESARALATELHRFIDESQLDRIDLPGKMGLDGIPYLRFANVMIQPVWKSSARRARADHDGRAPGCSGSRLFLRSRVCASRRRRQPPHADPCGRRDGCTGWPRPGNDQGCEVRGLRATPDADPAGYVRAHCVGARYAESRREGAVRLVASLRGDSFLSRARTRRARPPGPDGGGYRRGGAPRGDPLGPPSSATSPPTRIRPRGSLPRATPPRLEGSRRRSSPKPWGRVG